MSFLHLKINNSLIILRPIHLFIHQSLYSHLLGLGLSFSSVIFFTHTVGLLGRVISPTQGRYLHRINAHTDTYSWLEFESTIPVFERAKTVHILDRAATVINLRSITIPNFGIP
jgi:hypothetical protein